ASKRRPRQFTNILKITGSADAQASAGLSIPFGPYVSSAANSITPGVQFHGGPSFEVPTLETAEFFAGIFPPIDCRIFYLYFQSEFPRDILLNMFIEKIVMTRDGCGINRTPRCQITFQNYPGKDLQIELFQAAVAYLIQLGLNTEAVQIAANPAAKPKAKK